MAAEVAELRRENLAVKRTVRELSQTYVAQGKVELPPASVHEAALRAQARCPNLLVTGKAMDLSRDSEYADPEKVYQVLLSANDVAAELAAGRNYGHHWGVEIVARAAEQGGYNLDFKAHISKTAKGDKFRREYEVSYLSGGKPRTTVIEPHILLQRRGNAQEAARIFLDWDPAERKLIVSRIGVHPKNLES